jgi:2',3'-cyclic-nucleotide 2'-phosphodiesterase (5'-nucleotidase family)
VYGYAVYCNTSGTFSDSDKVLDNILPTGETVTAVVPGLANGTIYHVWVKGKASNGTYASSPSTGASGTPAAKAAINYSNTSFQIGIAAARFINEEAANSDRLSRKKETALGDLVCDGLAWYARDTGATVDFAYLNGGIITGGLAAGPITVSALKAIMPYDDDKVAIFTLTGTQVIALFNYAAAVRHDGGGGSGTGAWGMVSKEVRYTIRYPNNTSASSGLGVIENLTFNGAPINPAAAYRIATSAFLMDGGDGYAPYMTPNTSLVLPGVPISHAVGEYIYDQDAPLVPSTDGRVTLIGGVVK